MKKRRVKQKLEKDKILIVLFVCIILLGGFFLVENILLKDYVELDIPNISGPQVKVYEISFAMAGDMKKLIGMLIIMGMILSLCILI